MRLCPFFLRLILLRCAFLSASRKPGRGATVIVAVDKERLVSSSEAGGGPAFVGQIFSVLDPYGNGLIDAITHFNIPYSRRISDAICSPNYQIGGSHDCLIWPGRHFPVHRCPNDVISRIIEGINSCDPSFWLSKFFSDHHSWGRGALVLLFLKNHLGSIC